MSTAKYFFVRELVRLRRTITELERGLENHAPDDPHTAGQREILESEIKNRQLLIELVAHASNPAEFLMECRMRYARAERQHERVNGRNADSNDHSQQDWWSTLGQMQYLEHLIHDMEKLLHEGAKEDIKREMQAIANLGDVNAALDPDEIVNAIAQADAGASDEASPGR